MARIVTEIANLIDATVEKFSTGMRTSGNNAWKNIAPVIDAMPIDEEKRLMQVPSSVLNVIINNLQDSVSTQAHKKRINGLKKPLEEIRTSTLRDFSRKFGLVSDQAIDKSKVLVTNTEDRFDSLMGIDAFFDAVINPVIDSFNIHINAKETRVSLKGDLENRIRLGIDNFSTQRANTILEQYSRELNEIFAASFNLVWAKYSGPSGGAATVSEPRPFCNCRVNGYFHMSEIKSWAPMSWDGKITGTTSSTIFTNLGGYNCRHKLVYVKASQVPDSIKDAYENKRIVDCGTN